MLRDRRTGQPRVSEWNWNRELRSWDQSLRQRVSNTFHGCSGRTAPSDYRLSRLLHTASDWPQDEVPSWLITLITFNLSSHQGDKPPNEGGLDGFISHLAALVLDPLQPCHLSTVGLVWFKAASRSCSCKLSCEGCESHSATARRSYSA